MLGSIVDGILSSVAWMWPIRWAYNGNPPFRLKRIADETRGDLRGYQRHVCNVGRRRRLDFRLCLWGHYLSSVVSLLATSATVLAQQFQLICCVTVLLEAKWRPTGLYKIDINGDFSQRKYQLWQRISNFDPVLPEVAAAKKEQQLLLPPFLPCRSVACATPGY